MEPPKTQDVHVAVVLPLKEDYDTATELLAKVFVRRPLRPSKGECTLGKVGVHNVVLATGPLGTFVISESTRAAISESVKAVIADLLQEYPCIRAGFLIGVDAIAPHGGVAKLGDIVLGIPQGFEPGVIQLDAEKTSTQQRLFAVNHLSPPPLAVRSAVQNSVSSSGCHAWAEYLKNRRQSSPLCPARGQAHDDGAKTLNQQPSTLESTESEWRIFLGKIGSHSRPFSDNGLLNKVGIDNDIRCFEAAAATLESHLPFLLVSGVTRTISASQQVEDCNTASKVAAAYAISLIELLRETSLTQEHPFTSLHQYAPFDLERAGFRLLRLQAGTQGSVECHLFQAYLDEPEDIMPYEALSYAWGDKGHREAVIVDDHVIFITRSLYDALQYLRMPSEDRILWIDALCIDQNNIIERGHQVGHMSGIYGKAERAIIWLGPVNKEASLLLSAVNKIKNRVTRTAYENCLLDKKNWRESWPELENGSILGRDRHGVLLIGLRSLMTKQWFRRVWVLQEVANARAAIVQCHGGTTQAKWFALLPRLLGVKVDEHCQAVLDIMPGPMRQSSWWSLERNLATLLWEFQGCEATDPRDRIYALLGLASDMEDGKIQADYSKNEEEPLRDTCHYLFGRHKDVDTQNLRLIKNLQAKLPGLSGRALGVNVDSGASADALKDFLNRQGELREIEPKSWVYLFDSGESITSLLLDKFDGRRRILEVTEQLVIATINSRPQILPRILDKQRYPVLFTSDVMIAAIKGGPQTLDYVLTMVAHSQLRIKDEWLTEEGLMIAAIKAGNTLDQVLAAVEEGGSGIKITEALITAAASVGQDVLQRILARGKHPIETTEGLIIAVS